MPTPANTIYLTQADYESFYSAEELARLVSSLGVAPLLVFDTVNAEVDSYVAVVQTVALAYVPGGLKQAAADIARYRLHKDKTSPAIKERFDAAIRYLERIAAGKVALPFIEPPPVDEDATSSDGVMFSAEASVFTRSGLRRLL
jgi:phage gp36-like protein